MVANTTIKSFYKGVKFSVVAPMLNQVAQQNGLKLGKVRDLKIAKAILVNSIMDN